MKNKLIPSMIIISFIAVFLIFYKGLQETNIYTPNSEIKKDIPIFSSISFDSKENVNSSEIFNSNKFYLLNIWASWCVPCRQEHAYLMRLSESDQVTLIGLNYKDNFNNAQNFLKKLGNPYETILLDEDGTTSIELGAYGVPETFLIHKNKIVSKYIGPLNEELINEIYSIIK
jgi:cytochrome c biogenesis protein CcmG/thiol:disulfide interchange protein DsbE